MTPRRSHLVQFVSACVLVLISLRPPAWAQQSEVLTNQSVVDLVHNGLGNELIIKMINEEPNHFLLTSAAVIRLKQQGVPQPVIAAMLNRKAKASDAPAAAAKSDLLVPSAARDRAHNTTPNFTWHTQDKTDKMTGQVSSVTYVDTPAITDSGERLGDFEAQVTCSKLELDLKITFVADATPGFGFKQNTTTYYVTGGLAGALQAAHNHKKAWTETRVKIDNADPVLATSEDDYLNYSTLYFNKPYDRDDQSGASGLIAFSTMLAANKPVGYIDTFLNARRILLEPTFEHGEQATFEIHPQDPSFAGTRRRCAELAGNSSAESGTASSTTSAPAAAVSPYAPPRSSSPPPPPPPRYVVPAGSTFKVSLQEPVTLEMARTGRLVHGQLTQALQATGATPQNSPNLNLISLPAGSEVLLRPRLNSYNSHQAVVQIDCVSFLWKGASISLPASSPSTTVSLGNSAAVLNALGPAFRVRVPQARPDSNPTLLKAKSEQYNMTVNTLITASTSYQP